MKITDIRTAEIKGHGYSTYVRVYTDEGIIGNGECIHGGEGCPADGSRPEAVPDRRGPAQRRPPVREDATPAPVRWRDGGRHRHRHDRDRDRPLGRGRQGARRAGLPAARRQVPRHGPPLLRQPRREGLLAGVVRRARARGRFARGSTPSSSMSTKRRPDSATMPGTGTPRTPKSTGWSNGSRRSGKRSARTSISRSTCTAATTSPAGSRWRGRWSRSSCSGWRSRFRPKTLPPCGR